MNDALAIIPELEPIMNDADLDAALLQLRDALGDLSTLNNIIIGLRHNASHLMEPMLTVLHEARDAIDATLSLIEGSR